VNIVLVIAQARGTCVLSLIWLFQDLLCALVDTTFMNVKMNGQHKGETLQTA